MTSTISKNQKTAIIANLKASYIYVLIPFTILICVKGFYEQSWEAILLAADWSLASCILFGQVSANLSKAVALHKGKVQPEVFSYYIARRFFGIVVALITYVFMLIEPNLILGSFQVLLFIWASIRSFTDGVTTEILTQD